VAKESTMLPLGTTAPPFSLPDVVSGQTISLDTLAGRRALLVMFISRHCPYVRHVQAELANLGRDYADRDVGIVAICANDPGQKSEDAPESLREQAEQVGFTFPYCFDESQATAKAFTAACTPDFFLFDADRRLAYRGQLDDSRPGNDIPVTARDARAAVDALLSGKRPSDQQRASIGCSIKWKPGNAPSYA